MSEIHEMLRIPLEPAASQRQPISVIDSRRRTRWSRTLASAQSHRRSFTDIRSRRRVLRRDARFPSTLTPIPEAKFKLGSADCHSLSASTDGTRKILNRLADSEEIESVIIPPRIGCALDMSSQVGCALAVMFARPPGWACIASTPPRCSPKSMPPGAKLAARGSHQLCLHGDGRAACEYRAASHGTIMTSEWGMEHFGRGGLPSRR